MVVTVINPQSTEAITYFKALRGRAIVLFVVKGDIFDRRCTLMDVEGGKGDRTFWNYWCKGDRSFLTRNRSGLSAWLE
ncbi:MAG: hypothetical protein P2A85_22420 [Microcoleus anatoxicus]|uniref:hypothetical protein n=1 Tax=Microcoleus anatoxicus TaxID=2705319 RepID=UPI00366E7B4C